MVMPIAKKAGKAVGKHALRAGARIAQDISDGADPVESAKKHVKETGKKLVGKAAKSVFNQKGEGFGKRPPQKGINKGSRRQKKQNKKFDIFQNE
ncbi:MAG: hypothetical protein GY821_01910 [Gammaproteobacteria bacterium]|nr:hypothetical protein [Gammaproteobacteria bacterium]